MVWWGARNGRVVTQAVRAPVRPATRGRRVVSRASAGLSAGRMGVSQRTSIDVPDPERAHLMPLTEALSCVRRNADATGLSSHRVDQQSAVLVFDGDRQEGRLGVAAISTRPVVCLLIFSTDVEVFSCTARGERLAFRAHSALRPLALTPNFWLVRSKGRLCCGRMLAQTVPRRGVAENIRWSRASGTYELSA
jgi:hypothetical protein